MALEIIIHLDMAQKSRALSSKEIDLRERLKRRIIGFTAPILLPDPEKREPWMFPIPTPIVSSMQ
jgi:hypothetical protein